MLVLVLEEEQQEQEQEQEQQEDDDVAGRKRRPLAQALIAEPKDTFRQRAQKKGKSQIHWVGPVICRHCSRSGPQSALGHAGGAVEDIAKLLATSEELAATIGAGNQERYHHFKLRGFASQRSSCTQLFLCNW